MKPIVRWAAIMKDDMGYFTLGSDGTGGLFPTRKEAKKFLSNHICFGKDEKVGVAKVIIVKEEV